MSHFPALSPAQQKWPNVPACYGWLALDRRGDWRLQGERVMHRGLINFLNQNYGSDDAGHWFVQNGPQRVYVDLAATPWVFRREGNALLGHTGLPAGAVKAVVLDTEGNLYLHCELGIGILDDRDLAEFLIECQTADGDVADESAFAELMQGSSEAVIFWHQLPLTMITAVDLPIRFKFNPKPCA